MESIHPCADGEVAPGTVRPVLARRGSLRRVADLLAACSLIAALACGGGGGGGGSTPSGDPDPDPPPDGGSGGGTTPPPTSVPMQTASVRFLASESDGVIGYRLSIATASGRYGSGIQLDVPVGSADDLGGGVLEVDVEVPRDSYSYLAMRAYSASAFSAYSNEIVIPPESSSASSSAVPVGESDEASSPATSGSSSGTRLSGASGSYTSTSSSTSGSASAGSDSDASGADESATLASTGAPGSLDFDGAGEYLSSSASAALGVSQQLSLSLWLLADPRASGSRGVISVRGGGDSTQNRVELTSRGVELRMAVHDASGQLVYQASYGSALVAADWQHVALTFDAAVDAAPMLFVDGRVLAPESSELTGSAPIFSDTPGLIVLGGGDGSGVGTWFGAIGHVALFATALDDEAIDEIWFRGHSLDLRESLGAYDSASALLHYWRLGEDPAAVAADLGTSRPPLDLDDPAGGIDATDIVADAPAPLP